MEQDMQIIPNQLPAELVEIVNNSGIQKAEYHAATFAPFMIAVKEFSNKATALNKEQPGPLDAQIARQIRLAMVKNRSAAEQAKDSGKSSLIAEGNVIQSLFNVVVSTSKLVEADLTAIEKHAELKEQTRQNALRLDRMSQLEPYLPNPEIYPLGTMTDEAFENLLTGSRLALEQRQLAEQQAEAERVRIEAEQLAEQGRIREENEQLRQAAERNQQLQSVRLANIKRYLLPDDVADLSVLYQLTEDEFNTMFSDAQAAYLQRENIKQQEREEAARIQAEKDAQAKLDRIAREAKLAEIEESNRLAREKAAVLQAEKDEAERLEQERANALQQRYVNRAAKLVEIGLSFNFEPDAGVFSNEYLSVKVAMIKDIDDDTFETQLAGWKYHMQVAGETARLEAARVAAEIEAAKAPERDRLKAWVESISLPTVSVDSQEAIDTSTLIELKFTAFKTWALQQIEAL